jgi:hypothetical protein
MLNNKESVLQQHAKELPVFKITRLAPSGIGSDVWMALCSSSNIMILQQPVEAANFLLQLLVGFFLLRQGQSRGNGFPLQLEFVRFGVTCRLRLVVTIIVGTKRFVQLQEGILEILLKFRVFVLKLCLPIFLELEFLLVVLR